MAGAARRGWRRGTFVPYLYLTPLALGTVLFTLIPALYNVYISFTNFGMFHFRQFDFVGLENYFEIFSTGSAFVPVLTWTVIWTVLTSFCNIAAGLFLALLLNNPQLRERNLYRTLLILPWALPNIITIQMWAGLLAFDQGAMNLLLKILGLAPVRWLSDPFWARVSLIMVNLWLSYPFFMTIFLAALQSIPAELYEAAALDGAGRWARFRLITFPLLTIATIPLTISQLAFQFNNFGIVYLLTGGDPLAYPGADYGLTDILVTYMYKLMRDSQRYGLTAAYGTLLFLVIAAFTYVNARLTRAFEENER